METHSIFLAWEIPWTEEPGGLQSMGLQRVGRDPRIQIALSEVFDSAPRVTIISACQF